MHIKTIKGRKYYYESKRVGKKVTSVYIGPVDKRAKSASEDRHTENVESVQEEEFYVG